ncbi:DUF2207 domain-containing protein [Pedococcus sp.]|uniref:DUF2207 domain-containing protein n=1 Tax=Pedococcus sp. TaxID=2860345 RepID=UPI002E11FBD5|nr:DUF2207 domain-containing protein [Pedococcus sp.]
MSTTARRRPYAALAGLLVLLFGSLVLASGPAEAATAVEAAQVVPGVQAVDQATQFHVDFTLNRDGSVDVAEHLTWQFPQGEPRHGIERLVRVRVGYQNRTDVYREYPISAITASSPSGAPAQVSVSDAVDGASVRIRVGDPQQTVSGTQSYVVRYHLAAVVNGFPDHAELYWNLVQPGDTQIYQHVTATVTGPAPSDRAECFYGERGSTSRCTSTPGAVAQFSAPDLQPGQGVSLLVSLPRSAFGALEPVLRQGTVSASGGVVNTPVSRAVAVLALGAGLTLPLLAAGLMGTLVYTRGRDERYAGLTPGLRPGMGDSGAVVRGGKPVVTVQFAPPEGVQPGMVGTIIDETVDTVDVAATLVDLAVRGYLTIEPVGDQDWRLTRTTPAVGEQALLPYEVALYGGVFSGSTVLLSELRNEFKPTLDRVQSLMYDEVVRRGWFRRSPQAQRAGWTALGGALVAAGVFGFFWLGGRVDRLGSVAGVPVPPGIVLLAGTVLAGVVVVLLGRRMAYRTADGSAVLAQSLGFKQYLVTAEANQIRWEEAQDIFSRYLPFAIVFGVASQWASTFEQVAESAAAAGHVVTLPFWYLGGGYGSFGGLADSMDSFASTAGGTFASTPGGSGGSGFSSGGGFSGGGGGGSSGGSW